MSDPKRLLVLWSKSAVGAAGSNISKLQSTLTAEALEIAAQARKYFLYALPSEGEKACFVCSGHELPDTWEIFVQKGFYAPMPPISDDDPNPALRGKVFSFPEVIEDADNEIYAAYEDIWGH